MAKFAIIGTHNTGKTTALWQVGVELKKLGIRGVGLVPEIIRGCPYPIEEKETFEAANWILLNQILAESDAQLKYKHVICDRSVIDQIIYFENVATNAQQRRYLRRIAENWLEVRPYNIVFLFTPSCLVPIPKRSSLQWRRNIERAFAEEASTIQNCYFVTNEKLDDKVAFVVKKILQEIKKENREN